MLLFLVHTVDVLLYGHHHVLGLGGVKVSGVMMLDFESFCYSVSLFDELKVIKHDLNDGGDRCLFVSFRAINIVIYFTIPKKYGDRLNNDFCIVDICLKGFFFVLSQHLSFV